MGIHMPVALSAEGATGTCVVLITPDAERTMRTSLGVSTQLAPIHIDASAVSNSRWLFIEGYVFSNSDDGRAAIKESLRIARDSQTKVAITCSDAWIVSGFEKPLREALQVTDLIFANEEESVALAGAKDVVSAGRVLKAKAERMHSKHLTPARQCRGQRR